MVVWTTLAGPEVEVDVLEEEPTGISPDRAVVDRISDDAAVLLAGPGRTPLHLGVAELPDGAEEGTWVVLDLQCTPPLVIGVDHAMTEARRSGG
jgi:hypothetical protein